MVGGPLRMMVSESAGSHSLQTDLTGGRNGQNLPRCSVGTLGPRQVQVLKQQGDIAHQAPECPGSGRTVLSLARCTVTLLGYPSALAWARNWDYSETCVRWDMATGKEPPAGIR